MGFARGAACPARGYRGEKISGGMSKSEGNFGRALKRYNKR
jgi:hypothetical protein